MDSITVEYNKQMAAEMKERFGYAPNPLCTVCNGFGRIHPIGFNDKPDYTRTIACPAPGCLKESFENRGL